MHNDWGELALALETLSCFYNIKCWYEQGMLLFQEAAAALAPHQANDCYRLLYARILAKQGEMQSMMINELGQDRLRKPTETLLDQVLVILQDDKETVVYGEALRLRNSLDLTANYEERIEPCLAAIAIFEKHHDHWRVARALEGVGFATSMFGYYELAIQYYERGIHLSEQLGDQRTLGDILCIYGEIRRALGEYQDAMQLAQAGLAARSAVGNKRGVAFSLYLVGDLSWRLGNLEDALRYSEQSVALFTELGITYGLDAALNTLGHIALTLGNLAEARHQFTLILQPRLDSNTLDGRNLTPWALVGMAEVLHQEGQTAQAIELIEQMLRHPHNWQEYKDRALKLRSELAVHLLPEAMAAAQARGQTQPLSMAVRELLTAHISDIS